MNYRHITGWLQAGAAILGAVLVWLGAYLHPMVFSAGLVLMLVAWVPVMVVRYEEQGVLRRRLSKTGLAIVIVAVTAIAWFLASHIVS